MVDKKILPATILLILLDQATKFLIFSTYKLGESRPVIQGILNFTFVSNTGASWGMLKGNNTLLLIISAAAFIFIAAYRNKMPKPAWAVPLLLAGIGGNLIDRIIHGYVIDFIDFIIWPIFNVADSCLTIGAASIIAVSLYDDAKEIHRKIRKKRSIERPKKTESNKVPKKSKGLNKSKKAAKKSTKKARSSKGRPNKT